MYFILSVICMLVTITTLVFYKVIVESLLPMLLQSEHAAKFKARLSRAIFLLMMDIKEDFFRLFPEFDGDEPFEPFMDSPLHTCPPTEFIFSPPKEEVGSSENNGEVDANNNNAPRRRVTRRRGQPAVIHPQPVPVPRQNVRQLQVVVERIPPNEPRNINLIQAARQFNAAAQQRLRDMRQNRALVGPRRVVQLRALEGLISPPPQQNNDNNEEARAFQFD